MTDSLLANEPVLRLTAFLGILLVLAVAEQARPRRRTAALRKTRWPGNLGIVVVDTLVVRIFAPALPVAFAILAEERGWGLLNAVALPAWADLLAGLLLLDLMIYLQHVTVHKVPLLWRLHRMHHADTHIDVSTALRFHPLEILGSVLIKLAAVAALGPSAAAVLLFEVILNGMAMFNHANLGLPQPVDRLLRRVLVTPDMHRVHHSVHPDETDSNYGFNLSLWDRLFGTYRAQPRDGHAAMQIGLAEFREPGENRLDRLLTQPFRAPAPLRQPVPGP